ncbi:MAG: hypothetical protein HZA04_04585 [Nitrospinae bacterium]|nr:hypothetical protein [Nitrospinota bacterium]
MRKVLSAVCAFVLASAAAAFAEAGDETKWVLQLNENRGTFTSNSSPAKEGGQNLLYFSLGYMAPNYGVVLMGSHADTAYLYNNPGAKDDFHLYSLMDSTLSSYYLLPEKAGFLVRLGLDLNLPTGHSSFSTKELNSILVDNVSKDLLLVPSFGKGLNIAPNVVASKTIGPIMAGLGARYEITGEYNPASDVADKKYDPGDTLTLFGSLQYAISEKEMAMFDLSSVFSSRDKQGGAEVFKQGTAYTLGARYIKAYETTRVTYGITYGWQDKNQTFDGGGVTTEDRNTNNDRLELLINGVRMLSQRMMMNGLIGYKNIYANRYDSTNTLFDGGYQKLYFGGGPVYVISDVMSVTGDVKLFQVVNGRDTLEPDSATYRGWTVDIGFVYTWGAARQN